MSKVEPSDLVATLNKQTRDDYRREERELLKRTIDKKNVEEIYNRVLHLIPSSSENSLQIGYQSSVMGAIYGFLDRDLDPFSNKHYYLFSEIISEIKEAYLIVSSGNLDEELWIFETFDYGIKKVYYLDWKLYLSQICY